MPMKKEILVNGVYARAMDFVMLVLLSAVAFLILSILDNLA
jgi:hypothetical protein